MQPHALIRVINEKQAHLHKISFENILKITLTTKEKPKHTEHRDKEESFSVQNLAVNTDMWCE